MTYGLFSQRISQVFESTMADIEKLGRYDIVRVLGKGAMGVVYEGRDPNLDRQVAIKTIRVQSLSPAAAAEYEGRFRTEARSAARLNHPNIVSVFDSGQDADTTYLVMEFIQGNDLKHHLKNGARFSVHTAIVMVHDLLMALDHAHGQNVVHRDVKPANMLIEPSGRVKLADFGVARIQEPDETNLTQLGGSVGTPKYMSPEQAKGLRGDSRSDVFAAGVVLYELVTSVLPFDGENQFSVIHQIVDHTPALPSSLNAEVPATLDEVIARALAKNPDERYASARDFGLALRLVAAHHIPANGVQWASSAVLRDGSSTGVYGPAPDVDLVATATLEQELGIWNQIKDCTVSQPFLDYLTRFPAGVYTRRARQRLDQLALDNTSSRAQTVPQFQPNAEAVELDSTMGPFAATHPSEVFPSTGRRRPAGSILAVGAVLGGALALFLLMRPMFQPDETVLASATPPSAVFAPYALPVESINEGGKISIPVTAASTVPLAPALPTTGKVAPVAPRKPSPRPVSQTNGTGPSAAGQVCSDKVFIFRVVCVAEQCGTDRFRRTGECTRFKEMEKKREEGANNPLR